MHLSLLSSGDKGRSRSSLAAAAASGFGSLGGAGSSTALTSVFGASASIPAPAGRPMASEGAGSAMGVGGSRVAMPLRKASSARYDCLLVCSYVRMFVCMLVCSYVGMLACSLQSMTCPSILPHNRAPTCIALCATGELHGRASREVALGLAGAKY